MNTSSEPNKSLNILIAIDGSEHSLAAIAILHDLRLGPDSTIIVVTVLNPLYTAHHATFQAILEQTSDLLTDLPAQIHTVLKLGYPAEVLIDLAADLQPDLVVVGAKGLRATLGILLGGVAQQVIEYAGCPVLVVRAPHSGLRNVLLITDGSLYSQSAVAYLARFPLFPKTRVSVLHVMPPLLPLDQFARSWTLGEEVLAPLPVPLIKRDPQPLAEDEAHGHFILDQVIETLAVAGIEATPVLTRGDAATEIIAHIKANQIDLVVAGSRGLSRIQSLFLGSVSRKLVHYADCAVLIVKTPQHAES